MSNKELVGTGKGIASISELNNSEVNAICEVVNSKIDEISNAPDYASNPRLSQEQLANNRQNNSTSR